MADPVIAQGIIPTTKPVQLYGHDGTNPVRLGADSAGNLYTVDRDGMILPRHDEQVIDEADPNNVTITYKLAGVQVAVKTIAVSGTTTTITVS